MSLVGCQGHEAPDAALCQDVIHRLCLSPLCPSLEAALPQVDSCEQTLLGRSGCSAADFAFSNPSRARALECRLPLVRGGLAAEQRPSCDEVSQFLEDCGDLWSFLNGEGR